VGGTASRCARRELGHGGLRSAAIAARDRRTFVLLDGDVPPWCPRDGALREERGLLRKASPRLGPWRNDIEEQATDCHTDREWVWQLFTSFSPCLDHKRRQKDP
jgi:hypothetical protein